MANQGAGALPGPRVDLLPALVLAAALTLIALTVALPVSSGLFIVAAGMWLLARGRLFSVEGYLVVAGSYYWLGLANPFGADVHQVGFAGYVMPTVVALVVIGLLLIYGGALLGRRLAEREAEQRSEDSSENSSTELGRLYVAAYLCLAAGVVVALASYVRLGVPALAANSDVARTEFVGRLSPFTYYQWLLIEVGVGLATMAAANDRRPARRTARIFLLLATALSVIVVAGVYSRVSIGTPLVIAAVVWWSQGRRISPIAATAGAAVGVLVVSLVWITRVESLGAFTVYDVHFDLSGGPVAAARAIAAALSIFARTSVEVFGMFVAGTLHKLHGEIAAMSLISLLPGHHPGLGLFRVSSMLGYDPQSGTTVSLIGGMYADFGLPGILITAPLVGMLLGYLERRARGGQRLVGLYYAIALAYYLNMIYGGQLLDVTLLWKLWLAAIAIRYIRHGVVTRGQWAAAQLVTTIGLYGYGVLLLLTT